MTMHKIALLLLLGVAAASAARMLLEEDSLERDFGLDGDNYCDWGGKDFPEYPWAHPRPEREWYCKNAKEFMDEAAARESSGEGIPMIVYGDSIMQCLRWQGDQCEGVNKWFEEGWGKQYGAVSWALGSETSKTLFWRMLNANKPSKELGTKVVLMLVGSNNLGQATQDEAGQMSAAKELLTHVKDMSSWLMEQDEELAVILLGLLPKSGYGDDGKRTITVGPAVMPALQWYNAELRKYGAAEKRVRFVGVWDELLEEDGETIRKEFMGNDRLHPNLAGFKVIAKKVQPFLDQYLGKGNATASGSSSGNATAEGKVSSQSASP